MKYVEAMFVPSGPLEECGDAEGSLSPNAVARFKKLIKSALDERDRDIAGDVSRFLPERLASEIADAANEEIQIHEHHIEYDPDLGGSFSPLDRLGSVQHKLMLAGVLSHEVVAIVRLSDLTALLAERDRLADAVSELREDQDSSVMIAEGRAF